MQVIAKRSEARDTHSFQTLRNLHFNLELIFSFQICRKYDNSKLQINYNAYDKKSDEGSNSVRMHPENSGETRIFLTTLDSTNF